MFSLKAKNPYDFLSQHPNAQTIRNRVNVVRNHFLESESLRQIERLEIVKNIDEVPYEYVGDQYELELHFFEHFIDRVHRVSSLLILYSLLENLMAKICKDKGYDYKIGKYGVPDFKRYLESNSGMDFSKPELEKHWSKICTLNKLRNCLAHSEGDLEQYKYSANGKSEILKKTIGSTKGLSLYSNTIMISKDYVIQSIDAVENLLLAVK
jgi:hypothetical protein